MALLVHLTNMQLALDKNTHDVIKTIGGGITRVKEGRFVVQQVECKLRTGLGEWILDPNVGFVNLEDFTKDFNQFDIEFRAMEIILNTKNVLAVDSITVKLKKRKLQIDFKARTVFGFIDTSVKWGF